MAPKYEIADVQPAYQGHKMLPGMKSVMTTGRTFVLGNSIKEEGKLSHFTAFFTTTAKVQLEIYRKGQDGKLQAVFTLPVKPEMKGAQVVPVKDCFMLKPGDHIGFSSADSASPIAYRFDVNAVKDPTYFKSAGSNKLFNTMKLPYAFSYAAAYDHTADCST